MSVKSQHKTTLPHEAVELLMGSNNQIAVTGPNHQITTINTEELESTAHTVMFVTTETSANAAVAVPTTWGQRQGVLVVLAKSQECLRYYGNDAAAKGADISTSPIWYRAKRPILNITVRGVIAVLQTATEWIALISDAVTCREVAVIPIVTSVAAGSSKVNVIRAALTEMSRGASTFVVATSVPHTAAVAVNVSPVIDITAYTITSSAVTLVGTKAISKTPIAVAHLAINADTGIVAVPSYNNESKSRVGLTFVNPATSDDEVTVGSASDLGNNVQKLLSVAPLLNKRWLVVAPVVGKDEANANVVVVAADGSVVTSEEVLIGTDTNSASNKIDRNLITNVLPSGRVLVLNGHEVHTMKITVAKSQTADGALAGNAPTAKTSLAAVFKSARAAATATPATASSSRLASWSTLIDATATDVFALLDTNNGSDDGIADAIVDGLVNLSDLPDVAAASLAQLPFIDWYRAAKGVKNIHNTLQVSHLIFLSALKRGVVSVCSIAARAFDALYTLTGDDESSAHIAHEMRHCLQQISTWANEQMGKQIGVVTVHCTGKSPAIKQAMFVPHQPFAVSVKRHADIDRREYTTVEPPRNR